jgi:DNA-binding HxlR family transcriptional regulator
MVQGRKGKEQKMEMIEKTVAIIGDKWSLLIIGQLAFGKSPSRFNELMRALKPISSRTLSIKLANLSEQAVLEKTIEGGSPPYTQYTLTAKGLDLVDAFRAMAQWSKKWQSQPVTPDEYKGITATSTLPKELFIFT